jgi:hypothetical protein
VIVTDRKLSFRQLSRITRRMTEPMARALVETATGAGRAVDPEWTGAIEQWHTRYGEPAVTALIEIGLIQQHPVWPRYLIHTELGATCAQALAGAKINWDAQ